MVVIERNRRAAVRRCFASLRWLAEYGAEAVYLDGGSDDGSLDLVRDRFPAVHAEPLMDPEIGGRAAGLRQALDVRLDADDLFSTAGSPRWLLVLRADVEVDRLGVEALLRELEGGPSGAFLAMRLVGPDRREFEASIGASPLAVIAATDDVRAGADFARARLAAAASALVSFPGETYSASVARV